MSFKYMTSVLVAIFALMATAAPSWAANPESLANIRDATAIYTNPSSALAGGYGLLTDAAGIACIDMPGEGAMGVHYVNSTLVQSGTLDPARPQALVYEVQENGEVRLAAIEYVVFQSAWDESHSAPPSLFGQTFTMNPADNRFGLPAFYSLHAWIWKHNPSGTFASFNPEVQCRGELTTATTDDDSSGARVMGDMNVRFACSVPAARQ